MRPPFRERKISQRANESEERERIARMLNPAPSLEDLAAAVLYFEEQDRFNTGLVLDDVAVTQDEIVQVVDAIMEREIMDYWTYSQLMYDDPKD